MPGQQLQTVAFILARKPAGADKFEQLTVFAGEHGTLHCLIRISPSSPSPRKEGFLDLFDEVELWLESSNQGRTWFVKEHRFIQRHDGIGRSYEALRAAAALGTLVSRNPVSEESRPAVTDLLRSSLTALAAGGRPDVAWLKALYCFLRDEGYPVKQQWWADLPPAEQAAAAQLLNQPLAGQTLPAEIAARVTRRLEDWVNTETEIRF